MVTASLRVSGLLAAFVLLAGGCAGPKAPLEVGVKEYPISILLGGTDTPPAPQGRVVSSYPQPASPIFALPQILSTRRDRSPEPRAALCPDFPPLEAPKVVAENRAPHPPQAATYSFRNEGKPAPPPQMQRQIKNPRMTTANDEVSFEFVIVETAGGYTSTRGYRVVVQSQAEQQVPAGVPTTNINLGAPSPAVSRAGVFLTYEETKKPDGSIDAFNPASPIQLLPFPVRPGLTWTSGGSDPVRNTTVQVDGKVQKKIKVNACGTPLNAWQSRLYIRSTTPRADTTLTVLQGIGTQFGGIPLLDDVTTYDSSDETTALSHTIATINEVPLPAKAS